MFVVHVKELDDLKTQYTDFVNKLESVYKVAGAAFTLKNKIANMLHKKQIIDIISNYENEIICTPGVKV
jgi:hypothetical protein